MFGGRRQSAPRRSALLAALLTGALTGCIPADPPMPPSPSSVLDRPPGEVSDRLLVAMQQAGLTVQPIGEDGLTLRGHGTEQGQSSWAHCGMGDAFDPGSDANRWVPVPPQTINTEALVKVSLIGNRTSVLIDHQTTAVYVNTFTTKTFERPCPTNGRLEHDLLAAAEN
jgi:hypothetical protein